MQLRTLALVSCVIAVGGACGDRSLGNGQADNTVDPNGLVCSTPGACDEADTPAPSNGQCQDQYSATTTGTRQANLLFVLDRSGSMLERFGSGGSKLDALKQTVTSLASANQSRLRIGAMVFPALQPSAGDTFDNSCGTAPPGVDIAAGASSAVSSYLASVSAQGGTPTAQALRQALAYAPLNDPSRPNVVVLVTDGEPGCNDPASQGLPPADDAIAAVQALAAASIRTFVIGLPTGGGGYFDDDTVLNSLADAGQTARPGTDHFYRVTDASALSSTLSSIVSSVASCAFALKHNPVAGTTPSLTINGQRVARDPSHTSGWDLNTSSRVATVYGPSCDALSRQSGSSVAIAYHCS